MRKFTKAAATVLVMTMIMTFLGACSSTSKKTTEESQAAPTVTGTTSETTADTASDTPAASDSEESIVIRMAWWGNQTRNDITIQALNLYTQEHPNVTFETEPSDWSGYFDKLATQAATGSLPDLYQQDYGQLKAYYDKGLMLNLQPYTENGALDVTGVSEAVLQSGSFDGNLYAMCNGLNTPVLVYDKEIVEKAGVTIPEQMTWDDFFNISKTIYEKTGVQTYFDSGIIGMLFRGDGSCMYSEDGKSFGTKDDSVFLEYFNMVKNAMDAGWHVSPDILVEKDPSVVETMPIMDQTAWNSFTNSNQYKTISQTAGREMGMTMWPCSADDKQQVQYLKSSQFFVSSATTEYPDVVVDVINFLINSEKANEILNGERGVPVDKEVLASFSDRLAAEDKEVFDFIDKITAVATPMDPPTPSGSSEVGDLLNDMTEQVQYGQITPEDAAKQVFEEGNQILSSNE